MHHQGHETTEVGDDHFRSTGVKLWATVWSGESRSNARNTGLTVACLIGLFIEPSILAAVFPLGVL